MSYQIINLICIALAESGRLYFGTVKFNSVVSKTSQKLVACNYVECNRKKSMALNDNTLNAEGLNPILRHKAKTSAKAVK